MKIQTLRSGRIAVAASVTRWMRTPSMYDDGELNIPPDPMQIRSRAGTARAVRVGDEGVLVTGHSVKPDDMRSGDDHLAAYLVADEDGIRGNSDPTIQRLHGWRGTTGDWHVHAHGWRRVESVRSYRGSRAWRVVLSADLKPDVD